MRSTITKNDQNYPFLLREIPDAPEIVYCEGEKIDPDALYVAIVGTRRATPYGLNLAKQCGYGLAKYGVTVVSGLAYGIDAAAHEGALEARGKTIAVLGSGLNTIVPTSNKKLADEITQSGTLITEYEASMPPLKYQFPKRNRIIAGMCRATIVIEAPEKSGALITARLAVEYNRDVAVFPGNITQASSKGTNALIRDGLGYCATDLNDLFSYLNLSYTSPDSSIDSNKTSLLTPHEEIIYTMLQKSPATTDALIQETQMSPSQVSSTLSLLEMKGLIQIHGAYICVTR